MRSALLGMPCHAILMMMTARLHVITTNLTVSRKVTDVNGKELKPSETAEELLAKSGLPFIVITAE